MTIALLGGDANRTNRMLAARWRALGLPVELVRPPEAHPRLGIGDVVVGRIDVTQEVDGVEPGLLELLVLERAGFDVRNRAAALLAAHDKLRTARLLAAAGLPHLRTGHVGSADDPLPVPAPLVVKPRFGSWGREIFRCATEREARATLRRLADRRWFRRHGALVQELVGPPRSDVRVLVAGGSVVGGIRRFAAPGEWRTNAALGGRRARSTPDAAAAALAAAAVRTTGLDLAGVDLLPLPSGRYVVLEVNGAVDFDQTYSLPHRDAFRDAAAALRLRAAAAARVQPGDEIAVARSGHASGALGGTGLVVEVIRDEPAPLLRVRWPEGHETVYRPGAELRIVRRGRPRGSAPRPRRRDERRREPAGAGAR
jgi:[lysine-biosynthesis-protein LysW]---L-2-aminoadipate ligase